MTKNPKSRRTVGQLMKDTASAVPMPPKIITAIAPSRAMPTRFSLSPGKCPMAIEA